MAPYQENIMSRINKYQVTVNYLMNGIKEAVTIAADAATTAEAISAAFRRSVRSPDLLDRATVITSIDVKQTAQHSS